MQIITRQEAKAQGLKSYFTGKPCKRGHIAERQRSNNNCLACHAARVKAWNEANREKVLASKKAYREANREKLAVRSKVYTMANSDKISARMKVWGEANRDKILARQKAYHEANRDKILARKKAYREANREKLAVRSKAHRKANLEKIAAYSKAYLANNPEARTATNLRIRIIKVLRAAKATKSAQLTELLGASIEEVRAHLEAQFKLGMTWDNWSTHGWHVDHIKPCASFDLTDPEQQKACFHYSNLQPLWAKDNISKKDRLDWVPTEA